MIHATVNANRWNKEYSDITNNKYVSIQLKPLENNKYNISFIEYIEKMLMLYVDRDMVSIFLINLVMKEN